MTKDINFEYDMKFLRSIQKMRPGKVSPAFLFAHVKTVEAAAWLCDIGVNVNGTNVHGTTPLMTVKVPAVFKLLLSKGARLNAVDEYGNSPWCNAARNAEMLTVALATGEQPIDEALLVAAEHSLGNTRLLLAKNLDVEVRDCLGRTPLIITNDPEIMKLLIEAGADVDAQDNFGTTALIKTESVDCAQLLLEENADVNIQKEGGVSALMMAPNAAITKLLIEAGADVTAVDDEGQTALYYLIGEDDEYAKAECIQMAQLLLDAGCPLKHKDNDQKTVLDRAREWYKENGCGQEFIAFLEQSKRKGICVVKGKVRCPENDSVNVHEN